MYICRRVRLLKWLLDRGFNFIQTLPDKNNPKFNVWVFLSTPELMEQVEAYYATVPTGK